MRSRATWAIVVGAIDSALVLLVFFVLGERGGIGARGPGPAIALAVLALSVLGAWIVHPAIRGPGGPRPRSAVGRGAAAGALAGLVVFAALALRGLSDALGVLALGLLFAAPIGALVGAALGALALLIDASFAN